MADPNKPAPSWTFGGAGATGNSSNPFGQAASDASKPAGGLFGSGVNPTPSSGSGNSSTLFGQAASDTSKPAGGLFGSGTTPTSSSGTNLFGSTSAASGSSLFGATSGPSQASVFGSAGGGSVFGGGNKQASTLFGQPASQGNQPPASTAPASGFLGFTTPSKPAEAAKPGQGQTSNVFGGALGADKTGGMFGNLGSNATLSGQTNTTTPTSKPSTSLFGNSTTPAGPPPSTSTGASGSSLFGKPALDGPSIFGKKVDASTTQPSSQSGGGAFAGLNFGSSKPQESSSTPSNTQPASIFASTQNTGSSELFGKKPAQTEGGLFQNLKKAPETEAAKPATSQQSQNEAPKAPNLFGPNTQPAKSSTAPSSSAPTFSFPKVSQAQSSAPANPITSPSAAPSGFNLFNKNSSSSTSTPSTSATPFPSLGTSTPSTSASPFPSLGKSTPSASASLFPNLGKTQDKLPTSTNGETPGTTAPSSSAPALSSSLFSNVGKSTAPSVTSKAPTQAASTGATQAAGAGVQNLGASTTGPAPPAQSRLKNKSMDDIITRWASDLSKYQKEFQEQAEKVANWDRKLVENSEKIQKLYGSTLEAERATAEVERQLTAVENDQAELAHWLDYYEKEVDSMISSTFGQDGNLSGPDQERERT